MENKIKHLEMIQNIINRMANNSFLLKGWSVILIAAIVALANKDTNIKFVLLAFFPATAFWILDAYFLRQERLFRMLYDVVREKKEAEIDFSMNTLSLNEKVDTWFNVLFSKTLVIFHSIIIMAIIIIYLVVRTLTVKP
ncbi:MAG: hypothetical protein AB1498_12380 [bacterium]